MILFAIDCSESMFELRDDPNYEGEVKTCHILTALEAVVQIQKKKVIVGPNDSVGIMFFNTVGLPLLLLTCLLQSADVLHRRVGMRVLDRGPKSNAGTSSSNLYQPSARRRSKNF